MFIYLRFKMDFIHLLNTKKRKNKNLFNVFYKQKIKQNHHIKIDAKENTKIFQKLKMMK